MPEPIPRPDMEVPEVVDDLDVARTGLIAHMHEVAGVIRLGELTKSTKQALTPGFEPYFAAALIRFRDLVGDPDAIDEERAFLLTLLE